MNTAPEDDTCHFGTGLARALPRIVLATALVLLAPLIAMQFSSEVAWDLADFLIAAALLIGTGLLHVVFTRKVRRMRLRFAIGLALAAALLLVWLELAVGILCGERQTPLRRPQLVQNQ